MRGSRRSTSRPRLGGRGTAKWMPLSLSANGRRIATAALLPAAAPAITHGARKSETRGPLVRTDVSAREMMGARWLAPTLADDSIGR